jgi:hypothetical protein
METISVNSGGSSTFGHCIAHAKKQRNFIENKFVNRKLEKRRGW